MITGLTTDSLPKEITEAQKNGKKYIVFDPDYHPVDWVVAKYHNNPLHGKDGVWLTVTIEPHEINPTHYVEIRYDVA